MKKTIIDVANAMFKNRNDWKNITVEDKKVYFFIFNRYFSKLYPELAQLLNDKNQDGVLGMDILYGYFNKKPYPSWFWSKSEKTSNIKEQYTEKDRLLLQSKLNIRDDELNILIKYHNEELNEELKFFKKQDEQ